MFLSVSTLQSVNKSDRYQHTSQKSVVTTQSYKAKKSYHGRLYHGLSTSALQVVDKTAQRMKQVITIVHCQLAEHQQRWRWRVS